MATNTSSKRPAITLRCRNIKATIWQNVSENGPFFATTFSRPFKDQSGQWRNGISFGLNDLEALMNVAFEAKEWIGHSRPEVLNGFLRSLRPSGGSFHLDTCAVSRGSCEVAERWSTSGFSLLIQHRSNLLVERRYFVLHDVPDDF
jgi:hypothetical protein